MRHPSWVSGPPPSRADPGPAAARPWREAWQQALYGDGGFYRRSAPAAHFATSAHGIPGGGRLLAEAVRRLAADHGCTGVVDLGAGRGELLAELRDLDPELHLTGVDVVPRPEGLPCDDWLVSPGGAALPAGLQGLEDTLVLAHEWLDVVPCTVAERVSSGGDPPVWRVVQVAVDSAGRAWEALGPALTGEEESWARRWLGPGVQRAEIGLARDLALADLLSRVRSGLVVAVDYGHIRADRPQHGTLAGFRSGREVRPVPDGSCDLTAHVAFDAIAAASDTATATATGTATASGTTTTSGTTMARQRDLLPGLLGEAGPVLPPVPHELASRDPAAYLARLARRGALARLTAPGGLGDFWWLLVGAGPVAGGRHTVVP